MTDDLNGTAANIAIDAIARARSLAHGAFLALEGACDERIGLAVGSVVHAMLSELVAAEEALKSCRTCNLT